MSDYISKSALIEALNKEEKDFEDCMLMPTWYSALSVFHSQPTLSEKEIIRKAFERVVEKIDDLETHFDNGDFATCRYSLVVLKDVLRIVKEEGGIE